MKPLFILCLIVIMASCNDNNNSSTTEETTEQQDSIRPPDNPDTKSPTIESDENKNADKLTILQANREINQVLKNHKIESGELTVSLARNYFSNVYSGFIQVNVSDCPKDYRDQVKKVIDATREAYQTALNVPDDLAEYVIYLGQQDENSPDITTQRAINDLNEKLDNWRYQLSEYDAIVNSYTR